jgi:N6-L-threonylcarbamoyladenine synthase
MEKAGKAEGFRAVFPPLSLCTDNAAMIAAAGVRLLRSGQVAPLELNAFSRAPLAATAPWEAAVRR